MARLNAHAKTLLGTEMPVILAGDYNVMPQAIDCYDAPAWEGRCPLASSKAALLFFELSNLGYTDAIRAIHPVGAQYSYWDYQAGAWPRDNGIRIDHLMLSPEAADKLVNAGVDKTHARFGTPLRSYPPFGWKWLPKYIRLNLSG